VIDAGRPQLDVLHEERLAIEDLHSAAREQGYRDLGQVAWGVLEPDGTFSLVPWAATEPESATP